MRLFTITAVACAGLLCNACVPTLTVKHKVEPIHVTVDVYVKAEKELEEFFRFEQELTQKNNGRK